MARYDGSEMGKGCEVPTGLAFASHADPALTCRAFT